MSLDATPPTTPSDDLAQRIRTLEERVAFQQRLVEQLNEVVLAQRVETERLAREAAATRAAVDELGRSALGGGDLPHEKPPHY